MELLARLCTLHHTHTCIHDDGWLRQRPPRLSWHGWTVGVVQAVPDVGKRQLSKASESDGHETTTPRRGGGTPQGGEVRERLGPLAPSRL